MALSALAAVAAAGLAVKATKAVLTTSKRGARDKDTVQVDMEWPSLEMQEIRNLAKEVALRPRTSVSTKVFRDFVGDQHEIYTEWLERELVGSDAPRVFSTPGD